MDDLEIIKHPNSPWAGVDGIKDVNSIDEAIDCVIAACNGKGDFQGFDRIFGHIMVMFMDDEFECDIAGTIIVDFSLNAKVKAEGLAQVFRFFLHTVAGL